MTQKRKAELQRKLSVAQVPRPPDGLSDRIKADIPKYLLDTERDRSRLSKSMGSTFRVAASIFLLLGGAFLIIAVLSRTGSNDMRAPASSPTVAMSTTVADEFREADAKLTQAEAAPQAESGQATSAPQTAPAYAYDVASAQPREESVARREKKEGSLGSIAGRIGEREAQVNQVGSSDAIVAQRAPASLAVAPPPPPAAAIPPPQADPVLAASSASRPEPARTRESGRKDVQETVDVTANAPALPDTAAAKTSRPAAGLVRNAVASSIETPDRSQVFGISVDGSEFTRIRTAIERGSQPEPASVDVEALVNYFAGGPSRPPRDVRMEVEVTSAPTSSRLCCVLRVTIDTPGNGSTLPVAKNARLEIAFDGKAVSEFTRAGDDQGTTLIQDVLLANTSVTALYTFQLQPNPPRRTPIATVTLRYESLPKGKAQSVVRKIALSDINESWMTGSRRHRLASLGAVWAQSLRESAREAEIAAKAAELAKQEPLDPRARELATAAGRLEEQRQEQR